MGKITHLPDLTHFTDSDFESFIAKERKAYKKRLKMICPSKSIRRLAKEIAESDDPCVSCVYGDKCDPDVCRIPHTDAYMDALNIYPCYEGVLFYLCKELEREQEEKHEEEREKSAEMLEEMGSILDDAQSLIYDNLITIRTLAKTIIDMAADDGAITPVSLRCINLIFNETVEILNDIESGKYYETE